MSYSLIAAALVIFSASAAFVTTANADDPIIKQGNISHPKYGYTSEYAVLCSTGPIYPSLISNLCPRIGPNWNIASVVDEESNDFIAKATDKEVWIGAAVKVSADNTKYAWQWDASQKIRSSGVTFAYTNRSGASPPYTYVGGCVDPGNIYCNFADGQPSNVQIACTGSSADAEYVTLTAESSAAGGKRYWDVRSSYACVTTTCYACEQSRCTIKADCTEGNTKSALGYFPNCACVCNEGSSGAKCEVGGMTTTTPVKTTTEAPSTTTTAVATTKAPVVTTTTSTTTTTKAPLTTTVATTTEAPSTTTTTSSHNQTTTSKIVTTTTEATITAAVHSGADALFSLNKISVIILSLLILFL